jgi:hypothetical protein
LTRRSDRVRVSNSRRFTGLLRKSSVPASMPRTRSSSYERAVIITTGINRVSALLFN